MGEKRKGLRERLRRPSYAEVVATLALFIALGGASYAAIQVPKNSVGTKQLKKNAVTSKKVKNKSLLRADFKPGQIPKGATGPKGTAGSAGPTGPAGSQGLTGPTGVTGAAGVSSSAVMTGRTTLSNINQQFAISGISTAANYGNPTADIGMTSPSVSVTAGNFRVRLVTPPGNGTSRSFRLAEDGAVTNLGCEISDLELSCSDVVSEAINSGSRMYIAEFVTASPAPSAVTVGFTLGP